MITCPFCGHQNIDGVDDCEKCLQSIAFLTKPKASSLLEQRILKDPIRTLRPRKALVVSPEQSVGEVLDLLVREGVGCVVVAEGEQVVGIFSERDALMRLNTRCADLKDRPIFEYMTAAPEVLSPDDRIAFALSKMDVGGYRHMPVVEAGAVVGVISVRDMLRYVSENAAAAAV